MPMASPEHGRIQTICRDCEVVADRVLTRCDACGS